MRHVKNHNALSALQLASRPRCGTVTLQDNASDCLLCWYCSRLSLVQASGSLRSSFCQLSHFHTIMQSLPHWRSHQGPALAPTPWP